MGCYYGAPRGAVRSIAYSGRVGLSDAPKKRKAMKKYITGWNFLYALIIAKWLVFQWIFSQTGELISWINLGTTLCLAVCYAAARADEKRIEKWREEQQH